MIIQIDAKSSKECQAEVWIRGSYDPSVNATELNDNDSRWSEFCNHQNYDIIDEEVIEFDDWLGGRDLR